MAVASAGDEVVLAGDTTVAVGRRILEKPADEADLRHMLGLLSGRRHHVWRSEEHTSELQSLMRTSYAVFCVKIKMRMIKISEAHTSELQSLKNNSNAIACLKNYTIAK